MALVQPPTPVPAGAVLPRGKFRCYTKAVWASAGGGEGPEEGDADGWLPADNLEPLEVVDVAAPSMPYATFRHRVGRIKREGYDAFADEFGARPRDLFVKVELIPPPAAGGAAADPAASLLFVGRFSDEAMEAHGRARGGTGDQLLTAYGLAHELDKNTIATGVVTNDGQSPLRIDHVLVFNEGLVKGYVETGNRSAALVGDAETGASAHVFADPAAGDAPVPWTALDIVRHLLEYHGPAGIPFLLSGQTDALDAIVLPEVRVAGLTVFQAINQVIDRRRGIGWCVRMDAAGTAPQVHVFTTVDEDVLFDEEAKLPKNPTAGLSSAEVRVDDLGHLVRESRVRFDALARYDRIVVAGERVLVCFTASFADETLVKGWHADHEAEYKAGAGQTQDTKEAHDLSRARPQLDRVYTTFLVPRTWNFMVGRGDGSSGRVSANVGVDAGGRVVAAAAGQDPPPARSWGHTFVRHLPLRQESATPAGAEPEYQTPLVLLKTADGKYFPADNNPEGNDSCNVRMLDRDLGLVVNGNPNHLLAKGTWASGGQPAKSELNDPPYDYREMIATVAMRTDERLAVVVDVEALEEGAEPQRVLRIDVPDAELWYVVPGTVTGVHATTGQPVRHEPDQNAVPPGGDPVVRDDSARLRQIAALAKAWYAKERKVLSLTVNDLWQQYPVGTYVRSVGSAWQNAEQNAVNSVVSSVHLNLERYQTTIRTQFSELDVRAGGGGGGVPRHTVR